MRKKRRREKRTRRRTRGRIRTRRKYKPREWSKRAHGSERKNEWTDGRTDGWKMGRNGKFGSGRRKKRKRKKKEEEKKKNNKSRERQTDITMAERDRVFHRPHDGHCASPLCLVNTLYIVNYKRNCVGMCPFRTLKSRTLKWGNPVQI